VLLLLAVVALVQVGACSSGGGNGNQSLACEDACNKMNQCDPDEYLMVECLGECGMIADVLRGQAFDSVVACIGAAPCAALDPEACMQQAADEIDDSVLDEFLDTICDKDVECEGGDKPTCLAEMKADEDLQELKIISDAGLDCLGACLSSKSCAELAVGDPLEACAMDCDISFD